MSKQKSVKPSRQQLTKLVRKVRKYLGITLLTFFVLIYGFMLYKINGFMSEQPSQTAINADLKTAPHPAINQKVVNQLYQLKGSSVSVQSLLNQQRQNPFQ